MSYVGEVKSFNDAKGYGFITSEEAADGKDIFLPKRAIPGGMANKGDKVRFNVSNENSGIVAIDVAFLNSSAKKGYGKGAGGGYYGKMQPYGAMQSYSGDPGASYIGVIKSFNPSKGFGMISCDETFRLHGRDVFFLKSVLPPGLDTGDRVCFSVKMEAKGPVASDMFSADAMRQFMMSSAMVNPMQQFGGRRGYAAQPMSMMGPMAPYGGNARKDSMASWGAGAMYGYPMAPTAYAKGGPDNRRYFGTVKNYNAEKGWGHIGCEAAKEQYGKDVFLMSRELAGETVENGTQISFKVSMSTKGPQANEVSLMAAGTFGTEDTRGSTFQGTVKSFGEERGWGFIEGETVREIFGKDIFLHKRELDQITPAVGDVFDFTVEIDKKGEPVAKNLVKSSGKLLGTPSSKKNRASPY